MIIDQINKSIKLKNKLDKDFDEFVKYMLNYQEIEYDNDRDTNKNKESGTGLRNTK